MKKHIEYPFTPGKVRGLRVGDMVEISGLVFTARDRVHRRLALGGCCPVELRHGAIFHCGPVAIRDRGRWIVTAAGPTTSARAEQYMPAIIGRFGIGLIIGKGGMGAGTLAACRGHACAYLHAVGGAAQAIADCVAKVRGAHFLEEFGPTEALWELEVERLPALVTMDAFGGDLHAKVRMRSGRILAACLGRG